MSDTDRSPPPDLEAIVNEIRSAFDEQLDLQTDAVKSLLDAQKEEFRGSINAALTRMMDVYHGITARQDAQAKAIRFIAHDMTEVRQKMALPLTDLPLEDL